MMEEDIKAVMVKDIDTVAVGTEGGEYAEILRLFEEDYIQVHQVFPFIKHGFECFAVVNMLTERLAGTFFSRQYAEQRAFYLSKPVVPSAPSQITLDVSVTVK
jgi:hypothetical protein